MNSETQILALFEEGNPVPDLDGLEPIDIDAAAYLANLEQRSSAVTQLDTKRNDQKENKTVRPWWLVAAAVVVILAGIAVIVMSQSDETLIADRPLGPDSALEVVQAYEEAESIDAALVLVADDAVFNVGNSKFTGTEEIRSWMEALEDGNVTVEVSDFEVDGNTVRYHVTIDVLNDGDIVGQNVTVVVEDGLIQSFRSR